MRKYFFAAAAACWIGIGFAAGSGPEDQFQQYSAQARAYLTYDFGGPHRSAAAAMPLHYGLRIDSESALFAERYTGVTDGRYPAIVQFDFAADGSRRASVNGVAFAGRSYVLRQNDGGGDVPSAPAGEPGKFTWFDWGLLAVGIGGLGYLIAEVSKGKNSPNPATAGSGGTGGTTTAGLLGGTLGGLTGGTLGGLTGGTVGGVTGGTLGGLLGTR